MLVSRISPAPSFSARFAHSTASMPVSTRPPFKYSVQPAPFGRRFASIAITTHWLPNLYTASAMSCGFFSAAEFTETLSAPARSSAVKSSTVRMPPPTVNGINMLFATRETISSMIPRASEDAVMSSKTSSSAPCRSYSTAASTGSPASRKFTKFVPLTTLPFLRSRHGIMRLAYITRPPFPASWRRSFRAASVPTLRFFPGEIDTP